MGQRGGNRGNDRKMRITGVLLLVLLSTVATEAAVAESRERVVVVEAETVALPCAVSSRDKVLLILWYKDSTAAVPIFSYDSRSEVPRSWISERVLGSRASAQFFPDSKIHYLQLEDVQKTDSGLYSCRVDYRRSPTQRAKINLTVIVPPGVPTVLQDDGTQVDHTLGPYNQGSLINITCQVVGGDPPPQLTWWQGEKLLDGDTESAGGGVYRNTLTVGPLTRDHLNNFYACQAFNTDLIAPLSKAVTLDVNLEPLTVELLGPDEALTSGVEYKVTCQSTGARPTAVLTWWLDGQQLFNHTSHTEEQGNVTVSTLRLVPSEDDGGKVLQCLAQSPSINHQPIQDTRTLQVYYVPLVDLTLDEGINIENIKEGDNVTLICSVTANPPVKHVYWYHRGSQLEGNASAGITMNNLKLKLRDIQRDQAGLYSCVASNIVGDGESDPLVLHVKYVPVCSSTLDQVLGAAKEDQVELVCRVDASPDRVTFRWYFRTPEQLVALDPKLSTAQDRSSVLNYRVVKDDDYGEVLCFAANDLGEQSVPCSFSVVPTREPDAPENCTLTNQTTDTLVVQCRPGYDGGLKQRFILEVFESVESAESVESYGDSEGDSRGVVTNVTVGEVPVFAVDDLQPGTSYFLVVYALNDQGASRRRHLHSFTLPTVPDHRTRLYPTHIFPITPILGVLIGVVGGLVVVAVVVVVVMKLRGESRRAKVLNQGPAGLKLPVPRPTTLQQHVKEAGGANSGPDLILCRPESSYEDVEDIPHKLKHANIYQSLPYNTNLPPSNTNSENTDKDDVEYAELTFKNGRNKHSKKHGRPGVNGALRPAEDSTIYATIDHTRTAQQQAPQQAQQQLLTQQQQGSRPIKQGSDDLNVGVRAAEDVPLMDPALESSV
ncbi:hypothetical protein OTU49_004676 [Cherax quadricarinatus]|uniref:Uncharacterized protein n=1 Tax=Cherax quadricarinatus TaxID=27406 RepID=A0AAW0YBX5_CHEQU